MGSSTKQYMLDEQIQIAGKLSENSKESLNLYTKRGTKEGSGTTVQRIWKDLRGHMWAAKKKIISKTHQKRKGIVSACTSLVTG